MKKLVIIITTLFIPFLSIFAEETGKQELINFGVEVGVNILSKDVTPPENVRVKNNTAQAYYAPWHISAVGEYLFGNRMFGISSGLRFTNYMGYLGNSGSTYEWNIDPESYEGEYLKLHYIKQTSTYLGCPLEFRVFFIPPENYVRFYFKLDLGFNFLLVNKNKITFCDAETPLQYYDIINEQIVKPQTFNSTLDFAYGLRIGKDPCYFNIEFHYPTFILTDSPVFSFETKDLNSLNCGVRVGIQVPIYWAESKDDTSKVTEEQIQDEYVLDSYTHKEQTPDDNDSNGEFSPSFDQ